MSELPPLPERPREAHKNMCGRVLVIAGSSGMTGAGALAGMAALRSGAGLVTWALPQSLSLAADLLCLELLTLAIPETAQKAPAMAAREHLLEAAREANAVVLGPGLPVAGETGELLRLLIPEIAAPLILDAGALRALGSDVRPVRDRKAPTILTPHPGEMAELCDRATAQIHADREQAARDYAAAAGCVLVLKGAGTVVSDGERRYVNRTGNPGMATAGAGDVLCGVIAALLAQRLPAYEAACLGVHLHGAAGDLACAKLGMHGLIASDLIASLPAAFLQYAGEGGGNGEQV